MSRIVRAPPEALLPPSEHREVALQLPLGDLDAVLLPLLALQLHVALEYVIAERLAHEIGGRQLLDRLAERLRELGDPLRLALVVREVVEVRLHRLRALVALLDPLQARV